MFYKILISLGFLFALGAIAQTSFAHVTKPKVLTIQPKHAIVIELKEDAINKYDFEGKDGRFIYGKIISGKDKMLQLNNNRTVSYTDISSILVKNNGYNLKLTMIATGLVFTTIASYIILSTDVSNLYAFLIPFNYGTLFTLLGHSFLDRNVKHTSEWEMLCDF